MWELLAVVVLLVVALVAADRLAPAWVTRAGLGFERFRGGLKPGIIEVDGASVSFLQGGSGDEVLLLVHGFAADKDNFVRVAPYLKSRFRIIAVDLPGFGDSSRLRDASYEFAEQAKRLHAIAKALKLQRFHLGGSSMGGAIALRYGLMYPDDVLSLWLLAPGGVAGGPDSPMAAEYRASGHCTLVVDSVADYDRLMGLVMQKRPFIPYSVRHTLGKRAMADQALHSRIFDTLATEPPLNDVVGELKMPVLIVWGAKDRVLDVSGAAILHEKLPASRLIVREGIGHLPMIEEPARSARDFVDFVDGLSG